MKSNEGTQQPRDPQPRMTVPPMARTPLAVAGSIVALNVSMMSLKKKGTCTLRSCRSKQV